MGKINKSEGDFNMKKILAIILTLAMVLSLLALAACDSGTADTGTQTQTQTQTDTQTEAQTQTEDEPTYGGLTVAELEACKPNEHVKEKIEAGLKPLIFFGAPLLTDTLMVAINEGLQTDLEAMGFSYTYGDCEGNFARMVDMVENAVTMQASGVIIMGFVDGTGDACARAMEAGTSVFTLAAEPDFEVSGKVSVDPYVQGTEATKMVSAWIDQRYPDAGPGEIKAMITVSYLTSLASSRSQAYLDGLAADERINVVFSANEVETNVDEGFTYAEQAFTVDPDIRVALTWGCAAAVGVNNFIASNYPDQLDEFGIFCSTQDEALIGLILGVDAGGSCARGTIAQGTEKLWESMLDCVEEALINGPKTGYIKYDRLYSIDNFGYGYDSEA